MNIRCDRLHSWWEPWFKRGETGIKGYMEFGGIYLFTTEIRNLLVK